MKEVLQNISGIKVIFYTHPLCKTSWEMHPDWNEFYDKFHHIISFKYCVAQVDYACDQPAKAPRNAHLCQAVKAASLQSPHASHHYLNALCAALRADGADVSSLDLVVAVARGVARQSSSKLDFHRFVGDLTGKLTNRAVNEDLKKFHINRVRMLPTITLTREGKGIKLEGRQNYQQLVAALKRLISMNLPPTETIPESAKLISILQKSPAKLVGEAAHFFKRDRFIKASISAHA